MAEFSGQDQLVLCNHETDRRAWKAPNDWLYGPPTSSGNFFNREMGDSHITQQDGTAHHRSRKLLLPGFGVNAIGRDITTIARTLGDGLTRLHDRPCNLHAELCVLYTQALGRTQVKADLDDATLRALTQFEEHFISGLQLSAEDQVRWHTRPAYLALKSRMFDLFGRIAQQRLSGQSQQDTLQELLTPRDESAEAPLEPEELNSVIYLLLVAGVGNIAAIACCMLWALRTRPDWHAQLEDELRAFTPEKIQRGMKPFPRLQATIFEAERCFLPAPVIPKVTTRDLDVLGFHVPAHTHVLQMIGMAHFDEQRYPDPGSFLPERWLNGSTARANAYGGGSHLCLGMGVSRALLPLTLAQFVQHHQLRESDEPKYIAVEPGIDYSPCTTSMNVVISAR